MKGWMRVIAVSFFLVGLVAAVVCPYICWFRIDDCLEVKIRVMSLCNALQIQEYPRTGITPRILRMGLSYSREGIGFLGIDYE